MFLWFACIAGFLCERLAVVHRSEPSRDVSPNRTISPSVLDALPVSMSSCLALLRQLLQCTANLFCLKRSPTHLESPGDTRRSHEGAGGVTGNEKRLVPWPSRPAKANAKEASSQGQARASSSPRAEHLHVDLTSDHDLPSPSSFSRHQSESVPCNRALIFSFFTPPYISARKLARWFLLSERIEAVLHWPACLTHLDSFLSCSALTSHPLA